MAIVRGSTRVGGLIGKGLTHSLSPFIHNTSARLLGFDYVYVPFDFQEPPKPAFFDSLRDMGCYGLNITLPYKETVAARFPESKVITCNTLVPQSSGWLATSTDAEGFCEGLKELGPTLDDFPALICLGYGGAAKAIINKALRDKPGREIHVLRRTPGAGEAEMKGIIFHDFTVEALAQVIRQYPKALLVQCTSAPLRGDGLERFCGALAELKGAFVDMVYGQPSALLKTAESLNIPSQDGIYMLVHQALLAQKLWWGEAAEAKAIKAAIDAHLSSP